MGLLGILMTTAQKPNGDFKSQISWYLMVISRVSSPIAILIMLYVSNRLARFELELMEKLDRKYVTVEILREQQETQRVRFEALSDQLKEMRESLKAIQKNTN